MIAPQTAGCLGDGALLGQTALDVLKVALALTGFTLGGVDAPVGRAVIEPGSRDIHVHPDLMVIAQVLVDVGGCHLTGGNGANSGSRPGDAVASGEHVVHVADLAGQSSHETAAAGNGHAGLVKALNLDALADGHHDDIRRDAHLVQSGLVGLGTPGAVHIADDLGLDPQGPGHAVVVGLDADRGGQGYHLRSLGGCTGHLVGQGRHILQAAAVHTADLAGSQTDRTAGDVHSHVAAAEKNMSVSQRQMCEIAKAISYNSKVIVLDEPTSSLTVQEVEKLFQMMRMLRDQGISLIYISHKMDEIFEICDEISVLRDGNLVMTKSTKETNMNELIAAMVGRVLENRFPPVDNKPKDVILSIQHLSTKYEPHLQDITFDVHEGEIFGLYGLVGAGRTELLETIFGIRTRAAGRVYFKNQLMNFTCAKEAMDYGFALITEERKANGLFLKGNLTFNTTIANLGAYKNGPALSDSKMTKATSDEIKIMHTKCMGPEDMISALSGGNQQKVIFGKWLERGPQIFMMDEPTRGIDVGAKYEIYELIINMAKQGKTVIVVSSEMPEILGITNRIGVMSNGRLSGIVNTKETNQEELLRLSAKYL